MWSNIQMPFALCAYQLLLVLYCNVMYIHSKKNVNVWYAKIFFFFIWYPPFSKNSVWIKILSNNVSINTGPLRMAASSDNNISSPKRSQHCHYHCQLHLNTVYLSGIKPVLQPEIRTLWISNGNSDVLNICVKLQRSHILFQSEHTEPSPPSLEDRL